MGTANARENRALRCIFSYTQCLWRQIAAATEIFAYCTLYGVLHQNRALRCTVSYTQRLWRRRRRRYGGVAMQVLILIPRRYLPEVEAEEPDRSLALQMGQGVLPALMAVFSVTYLAPVMPQQLDLVW